MSVRRAISQQMLDSDQQLADAPPCGAEHGVYNGRSGTYLADLTDALNAERVDDVVANLDELHLDIWRVGIDRYEVIAQARVIPAARPAVYDGASSRACPRPQSIPPM